MLTGRCNCGEVAFTITGPVAPPSACHCSQCRRQSGHYWASANVPDSGLTLTESKGLRWFQSSAAARRGFCATCGAFLFWKHRDDLHTSIALGALDQPTGLHIARHIFIADKGDYYDLNDDLPKRAQ